MGERLGCSGVHFSHVVDWGVLSRDKYAELAIHRPDHPRHNELCRIVNSTRLRDPIVMLGNVASLRTRECLRDSMFS